MKFGRTPAEIENKRKGLLIYTFIALGGVFLLALGVVSFTQGRVFLGGMLIFALLVALVMACVTVRVKDVQPISLIFSTFLFALASYLLLSGGAEGTGAYWSYPILMLMALLTGPRIGAVFMCSYIAFITLFMLGPFSVTYEYAALEAARIIITSSVLIILILASAWIRMGSYGAISEASEVNRQLASTDSLTKLLNRNGLKSRLLDKELLDPAVVVVLDIDRFKQINDNHGHDLGDRSLRYFSKILIDSFKNNWFIGRYGGDEFVLFKEINSIGDVDQDIALFNEHLTSFNTKNILPFPLSVSIGYTVLNPTTDDIDDVSFLRILDKLMYADKKDYHATNKKNSVSTTSNELGSTQKAEKLT